MLDKSMEEEMTKTLSMFDEYAQLLNHYNRDVLKYGVKRTFMTSTSELDSEMKMKLLDELLLFERSI